ncbi:MAG: arabinofuranan 3-O-arabinosyltransferase, partial [Actinomycetota bacterium]|nr:arabinofuranan 3-O-arabinosyltransferase [Actinomycetota bacterium]
MRTPRSIVLVLLGCWTLLVLVVLLNSAGSLAIDIKPELYLAPGRMVRFFANPWQESPQLGWPSFNVGLAPVPAVVAGLQALGLSPVLSMRVLRIVLYTVAGWGLARLHRSLSADGGTPASRAAAAVAYVANPYAVVGGSTLAVLLPYALLPWQSLFLVRALRSTRPWRDVAGFGICFAAMSGMNAGVIPLLQLLTVPFLVWWVRRDARIAARHLWRVLAACAGTVVLVSLYWLVPSVIGAGQGVAVLENSETVEGINGTSSLAEVLRGLGFWGMYGQGARGPYQPGFADYLTSGPVVVLTLLLPAALAVAALVARGTARVVGLALLTVTALLMVGLYPPDNPSPLGHGLQWLFENVPVTGAFRTLNKLGSVLVLAAALLLAAAVASVSIRPAARWRWVAGAVVAGLAVAAVFPALSGGLYPRVLDVPGYWHDAADQLNKGRQDSRVWFVPGAVQPHYRWATDQPDDLALPLITGPSLVRTTLPVASPYAANFLAQVDTQLNEDSLYPGSLSAAARYLGVRNVLLRNDVVWEDYFGARPATLQGLIGGDRGLQLAGQFGSPGDGTTAAGDSSSLAAVERELPPLQDFAVTAHRPIVRAESLRGMVVVAGDAGSFSPLVASGLLADGQSFRYAGDLTASAFTSLLGPDRRLVLTDTNRRRTSVLGRLAGNQGPLLPAGADAGSSRTLFGPQDQTVLTVTGGATVSASQVGSSFGVLAEASPENALDGDPSTSWQFGDFGTAAGQQLQVRFDRPRRLGLVRMTAATLGTVQIDRLGLRAGGRTREVDVAADATAAVDLGQRPVRS